MTKIFELVSPPPSAFVGGFWPVKGGVARAHAANPNFSVGRGLQDEWKCPFDANDNDIEIMLASQAGIDRDVLLILANGRRIEQDPWVWVVYGLSEKKPPRRRKQ
jgi:hypothetical protein